MRTDFVHHLLIDLSEHFFKTIIAGHNLCGAAAKPLRKPSDKSRLLAMNLNFERLTIILLSVDPTLRFADSYPAKPCLNSRHERITACLQYGGGTERSSRAVFQLSFISLTRVTVILLPPHRKHFTVMRHGRATFCYE